MNAAILPNPSTTPIAMYQIMQTRSSAYDPSVMWCIKMLQHTFRKDKVIGLKSGHEPSSIWNTSFIIHALSSWETHSHMCAYFTFSPFYTCAGALHLPPEWKDHLGTDKGMDGSPSFTWPLQGGTRLQHFSDKCILALYTCRNMQLHFPSQ